ncbi:hypothetical protein [Mycobacterium sp. ACS1612]|uniref:hypothetical protein n=1 Tax=Mycobacterium sp. ACS1612 TaxID=1834117 RepID=UPI000A5CD640|nr:hypothetical protein [Mycobacterium sp. ACS1612]
MTALQDWLNARPVDPKTLKMLVCDALRNLTTDEPAKTAKPEAREPQLIRRGLERC